MLEILPHIETADVDALHRAANAVVAVCRRNMADVVESQARGFVSKARRRTPIAPRRVKREFVTIHYQGRKITIPTRKPYWAAVKGRGFARSGWAKAADALGIRGDSYVSGKREGIAAGHYLDRSQTDGRAIEVGNRVPYIETLDRRAAIVQWAMMGAYIAARKIIEGQIKRDAAAAWRRGSATAWGAIL